MERVIRSLTKVIIFATNIFIYLPNIYSHTLTAEQIYKKVSGTVVVILANVYNDELAKQGSGVIINDEGYLVINYHALADTERIEVLHNKEIPPYLDIIGINVEKDIVNSNEKIIAIFGQKIKDKIASVWGE